MTQKQKKSDATTLVESTTRQYSYWQAFYRSFYYPRVFIDVIKRWRGLGWLYLLAVILVFSIPLSIRMMMNFQQYFQQNVIDMMTLIPSFTIQNGQVNFEEPMPYLIKNKQQEVVGIIDTTSKYDSLQKVMAYPKLSFLVNKDGIFYRAPNYQFFKKQPVEPFGPWYAQKLNPHENSVFTTEGFLKMTHLNRIKMLLLLIIYPLVICTFFVMLAGFFLLLSMVGQFMGKMVLRAPLKFWGSCRLIAVSSTPAIVFLSITLAFDWVFVGSSFIFLGLIAFYFSLGAIVYRREMQQLARV